MIRTLGAAFAATVFVASLCAGADARVPSHSRSHVAVSNVSEVSAIMPPGGDLAMWNASPQRDSAAVTAKKKSDAIHRFARGIISRTSSIALSLTRNAMKFIGTPYVFGGTSAAGFDCSGYTQHVFAMLGIALPRTADAQYYAGHPTVGGLTTGDLVFFQTYEPGPSHVGIYIGNGRFIHSSSHGVMISALRQSYWANRYLGGKRVASLGRRAKAEFR